MPEPIITWLMLIKLALCYTLLFFVFPRVLLGRRRPDEDLYAYVFAPFVHAHFVLILLVHLLAPLRLYETLSLYMVLIIMCVLIWRQRQKQFTDLALEWMEKTDQPEALVESNKKVARNAVSAALAGLKRIARSAAVYPVAWAAIASVIAVSLYMRFSHAFTQSYYAASDPYVHYRWANLIGLKQQIYADGIYSYGYPSVISLLQKIFIIDPYYIVRFLGPLASIPLMASILLFLYVKVSRRMTVLLVPAVLYGVGFAIPVAIGRQAMALPMEYGMIFVLPGVYFLFAYFKSGRMMNVWLAAECAAVVTLLHTYSALFAAIGYGVVFLMYAGRIGRAFWTAAAVCAGGAFIGALPMLVALAAGLSFNTTAINYIQESVGVGTSVNTFSVTLETQLFIGVALAAAAATLAVIGLRRRYENESTPIDSRAIIGIVVFFSIMLFLYMIPALGLPEIITIDRITVFFCVSAALMSGVAAALPELAGFRWQRGIQLVMLGAIVIAVLLFGSLRPTEPERLQYNEAVQAYLRIQQEFAPPKEWNMISTTEELPLAENYGWHTQLADFVTNFIDNPDAHTFPTLSPYVFLFVEKQPLRSFRPDVAGIPLQPSDAERIIPPMPANVTDSTTYYYRGDFVNRRTLQAKAYYWAEQYRSKHRNMTIFFDNDVYRVYLITKPGEPGFPLR